jgi:hypothetical protein
MPEQAHPAIINREGVREIVREHLSAQADLLDDAANYGSNLVIRAIESSPKDIEDVVLCAVFLKQVVAMLDATAVLFREGAHYAAQLSARSAFEASVYVQFLSQDLKRRARLYIVSNYREERVWAQRAILGTAEELKMRQVTEMAGFNIHENRPGLSEQSKERLREVNEVLGREPLRALDEEFEKLRKTKGRGKHEPKWYEPEGPQSVKQVVASVGRLPEYELFYSGGSKVAHGGSYKNHFRYKGDTLLLVPVRHVEPVVELVSHTMHAALGTYESILKRYRPDELQAFRMKYITEWREAFLNVPKADEF